ncbi:MAG: ABC transporter permease [Chlorobi bacterium]|nr:ABC transporter permease [Chlorobiota bacterium]
MFNYRTIAILKRELREKLLSKTFILMTILLPVFMMIMVAIPALLNSFDSEGAKVEVVSFSDSLTVNLKASFAESGFVKDSTVIPIFKTVSEADFNDYLASKENDLLKEKLSGIIYIPKSALKDKDISYYSKTPKNIRMIERLRTPINKVLVEEYFASKNIPPDELEFARKSVDVKSFKVSKDEAVKEEGYGGLILSYLFTFLLYISLLMMGSMVLQSVIQEKSNRIVEVLLSSVTSKELMIGKILGAAITGLIQMTIWLAPVILVASTSWFMLPKEVTIDISAIQVIYLLFNFFIGLLIYVGLFAMVGSIFENPQDAQSGMWPIMLLIIIPFFISMSMIENPDNPIANIASMFPFAAIIVMPAKMALVDVPLWQVITASIVNVATFFAIFPIAGKIYRVGIMMTGKKPKWSEIIKWLKYKY